jgi:hypothetical protein
MLRPLSSRLSSLSHRSSSSSTSRLLGSNKGGRFMATQSGDDAKPPTALATLYLEDGSKFVGRSFGSHEAAVDGEVRYILLLVVMYLDSSCCYILCWIVVYCS